VRKQQPRGLKQALVKAPVQGVLQQQQWQIVTTPRLYIQAPKVAAKSDLTMREAGPHANSPL
jgi:hypothetical protein